MLKLSRIVTVLSVMGAFFRTAHGVTPEEETAFCEIVKNSQSSCGNLCSGPNYYRWGKSYYSSGKGEFCETQNGTITHIVVNYAKATEIGPSIGALKDLVRLELAYNSLTTISANIKSLTSLTILYTTLFVSLARQTPLFTLLNKSLVLFF